jgi:hypothetical protein
MDMGEFLLPNQNGELGALVKVTADLGSATRKKTKFEAVVVPGLATVTVAVRAVAMLAAGTTAVSSELDTKAVLSGTPFQSTVAPDTKPVPFMIRVNPGPPGAVDDGSSGWLMKGTGICANAE